MIIYVLLFLLATSFFIHIAIIILYIRFKTKQLLNLFLFTVITNMSLAISLSVLALARPGLIRNINLELLFWLFSGLIMFFLLSFKIIIFINVFRRSRNPDYYHVNYFGKKVYESGIIKQSEFLGFLVSFPVFLLIGAYFVARLINLIIYGHI